MSNTNQHPVEKFLLAIKGLHRDGYLDLEAVAIEVKKLDDEDAVTAYRTMKMISTVEPSTFAPIANDINDVLGLLKEQALRGGQFSPFATNSNAMRAVRENPEANIMIVLGRILADMFVFDEPTSFDALRTECEKYTREDRVNIAQHIRSNPMTPMIMPEPLLTEVMTIISPE